MACHDGRVFARDELHTHNSQPSAYGPSRREFLTTLAPWGRRKCCRAVRCLHRRPPPGPSRASSTYTITFHPHSIVRKPEAALFHTEWGIVGCCSGHQKRP